MHILDILGVGIIFVAVIYIGYYSTKKVDSSEDFLLAGRNLGKIQAGFSMAASDLGGSGLIGASAYCYSIGLSGAWWNWCATPAFIVLGIWLVSKLRPLAICTGPEFLEKRYNKESRVIASVMQICSVVAALSAQFLVGAVALNVLAGIPKSVGLAISVGLVILYTMGGGLIAVVNTDVFQFIILVGSVLVSVPLAMAKAGGLGAIKEALPPEFFSIGELGAWVPISWILMCFFMYSTQQAFLQRIFASKDVKTAKFAYVFAGATYGLYGLAVGLIGITMAVLIPGLEDSNTVFAMMVKTVLPPGIAGIVLGGIFAASMSTADSFLMAGTTLFINDIYKTFINKNASDTRVLWMSRAVTFVICVGGVVMASLMNNLINIIYLGGLFYSTSVFFPLVLGVFWKRANGKGALACILISLAVGLFAEFVLKGKATGFLGLPSNILAAIAGLVTIVVVSWVTKKPSKEKISFIE